ncbi:probable RNA helicase armi [Anopheles marshallii]|uniref:probable RNA helicase armi n=1 Tax=Anopheles marshallii TaxID=1521116 RepID=UPI00237BAC81|nr:probable RNA helicase armi [Anopheles marshallii]
MIRLTAWFLRKVLEKAPDNQLSLSENIRLYEEKLQQEDDLNNKPKQNEIAKQIVEPTDCFQTTGTITEVKADYFIIDGIYFVPKMIFKNTEAGKYVEENTKLQFLANRKTDPVSGETSTKVVKIISVLGNVWSGESDTAAAAEEEDWTQPSEMATATTYYKSNRRREPGTVIGIENDVLIVETDAGDPIRMNIDKTVLTFVPAMGDYVTLDCVVQMDGTFVDFKGEVLDVVGIEPTRTVSDLGTIVTIEEGEGGEIRTASNTTVLYQMEILNDYRPNKGDRVEFKAIENKHVRMRCIQVKLLASAVIKTLQITPAQSNGTGTLEKSGDNRQKNSIWQDKHGICISGNFDVTLKDGDDSECRKVTIKNQSNRQQKILKMLGPKSNMSQVRLKSPYAYTQAFLFPGESVEYEFEISGGGLFGRNEESCVWCFGGSFRIGRVFRITVGDKTDTNMPVLRSAGGMHSGRISYCKKQLALLNMRRAPGTVLAGRGISSRMNFIAHPLPAYNVPSELYNILLTSPSRAEVKNTLERPPYCLNEKLSPLNYSRIMKNFIYLEEISLQIEFRKHDIERTQFTPEESFLALDVPNIAEARPSIMVGDSVRATAPWTKDNTIYQGIIHRVQHSRVLLKFDQTFHSRYNGESYAIQFIFGRSVFRKQHHAIKRIQMTLGYDYLFPMQIKIQQPLLNVRLNARNDMLLEETEADAVKKVRILPWYNQLLNRYQKHAVVNVLRGDARPMPHIIFGPPGTGKTVTIIELIHQLVANVPSARVIVVTPSNSAAYLITERLARGGILQPGDFIRLVGMSQVEREIVPEHLVQYCATVDVADERNSLGEVLVTESGLRMKFQAKHIGRHRVTISTCLGVGSLMMMSFDPNHFTHVIIDEAGQAMEPETLIPICQVSRTAGSVVLVGDPKQLSHSVHFSEGEEWNSNISLMERLLVNQKLYAIDRQQFSDDTAGFDPRLVTMLRINYRSIPSVLSLYNDLFYASSLEPYQPIVTEENVELIAAVRDILRLPPSANEDSTRNGFFFCGINGTNKQSPESPSWFNPAEACMVHKIVERLYRGGRCGPDDIGIITPYVMQVRSIRRIFDAASLEPPKIGSVEEFQGQERKIIILSAVRSSSHYLGRDATTKLGFISAPKRINVAISRAKVVLVVVGNPHLLATDVIWGSLLKRALDGDSYCGCTIESTNMRQKSSTVPRQNNLLQRQYDDEEDEGEQY